MLHAARVADGGSCRAHRRPTARRVAVPLAIVAIVACTVPAEAGSDAEVISELQQQLRQMKQHIEKLENRLEQLEQSGNEVAETAPGSAPAKPAKPATSATKSEEVVVPAAKPVAGTSAPASAPDAATASSTPAWLRGEPLTVARAGAAYLNISFDTIVVAGTSTEDDVDELQLGDHDPDQRGFSLRSAELALDGAVDPYFRAFANVVFKLDDGSETEVELEEAYGLTTSLPWDLQVKTGQYFAEFGRQNTLHPHAWAFVDQPLILGRVLGGEGLRNIGARVSWLVPTPFYTEVFLGIMNGQGGTASSFRDTENTYGRTPVDRDIDSFSDLLFVPRIATSFDVTDTQTVLAGVSGAFGPNASGESTETEIYGVDLFWKWRPIAAQQGFPFVSWQSELMLRRYEAAEDPSELLPRQMLEDAGGYTQLLWGFRRGWVAALRGEHVTANNRALDLDVRGRRTRISPNLTWYPTEFSKLRLQYNYDDGQAFGDEHSVWLQAEFTLGAHGAHKFQEGVR